MPLKVDWHAGRNWFEGKCAVDERSRQIASVARRAGWQLVIGLGLTVALAVLAILVPGDELSVEEIRKKNDIASDTIAGVLLSRWGMTRIDWSSSVAPQPRHYASVSVEERESVSTPLPRWSTLAERLESVWGATHFQALGFGFSLPERAEVACGWPWRAFYARWEAPRSGPFAGTLVNVEYGLLGPGKGLKRVVIPYKPIWAGLIGDAAVLGAAAAGVVGAVRWSVRAARRRNGQCEGCGYEVKGLGVCPECGRRSE